MRLSRRMEHSADRGGATAFSPASASRSCAPWLLADGCCSGCDHLHAARNSTWLLLLQPPSIGPAHGLSSLFIAFAGFGAGLPGRSAKSPHAAPALSA